MFLAVLTLPLFSFFLILIFGSFIGTFGSMFISCFNLLSALFSSLTLFWYSSHEYSFYLDLWPWLNVSELSVNFSFRYDSLTAIMFVVVTTVSSVVHLYSCAYMYADPFLARFMSYLSLFTFFMLLLVSSGNLLVLFFGWEGVGLCSYLLIGFWYTRAQAGKAASKAFIINKIGDLFLLTGVCVVFMVLHAVDFGTISNLIVHCPTEAVEFISAFLFIGAVGKSAQVGLHTWLPDAMEGPTPVSALIHAATMVTAGVFLIIRCSSIFEHAPRVLYIIAIWGGVTALISGTIGAVQNDIKKIIAYSTCSQLGYMIVACGLSHYNTAFFHLFNHAFFKALLFLSAGSVIHLMSNEQDIRRLGSLGSLSPFIYTNVLIGSLALAGFPFLAGFYSKDLIIEISNTEYWVSGHSIYWLTATSAILTMYYSIRLLMHVFINKINGFRHIIKNHVKATKIEAFLLSFLCILSIVTGFIFKDAFVGLGSNYFNNTIIINPNTWASVDVEFIPSYTKLSPLIAGFFAFIIAIVLSQTTSLTVHISQLKTYFETTKWFYNELLNTYLVSSFFYAARISFEQYEKRVLDYHGPMFLVGTIKKYSV